MNFERVKKWVMSLIPSELDTILANDKGGLIDGVVNVFLSSFVPAICMFILFLLWGLLFGAMLGLGGLAMGGGQGLLAGGLIGGGYILSGFIVMVALLIFQPILFLLSNGVHWILAKLLGGTGRYSDQAFFESHVQAGMNILTPALIIVSMVPCLGSLLMILFFLYINYPYYKIINKVHGLDNLKAALVVIIPIAILAILVAAFYLLYFVSLFATTRIR